MYPYQLRRYFYNDKIPREDYPKMIDKRRKFKSTIRGIGLELIMNFASLIREKSRPIIYIENAKNLSEEELNEKIGTIYNPIIAYDKFHNVDNYCECVNCYEIGRLMDLEYYYNEIRDLLLKRSIHDELCKKFPEALANIIHEYCSIEN
jgi:hypothetical protein